MPHLFYLVYRAAELRVDDAEPQVPLCRAEQDRVAAAGVDARWL